MLFGSTATGKVVLLWSGDAGQGDMFVLFIIYGRH